MSLLQKALICVLLSIGVGYAEPLSNPLRELFDRLYPAALNTFDLNKDGKVSRKEAEQRFLKVDKDGNGFVSKAEYSAHNRELLGKIGTDAATADRWTEVIFPFYDQDRDGGFEASEWQKMFSKVDVNKDNEVSATEYREEIAKFLELMAQQKLV